jgi:hypothetical protein
VRQRIRLHCPADSEGPCRGRLVGRLLASDEDRLTLDVGLRDPVVVERRQITRLDVSRGRQTGRGAGQGALIGGAVLGLLSLAFLVAWEADPDTSLGPGEYVAITAVGAGAGALGGAVTGAVVGTAFERWERPKGAGLSVSFRF